MSIAALCKIEEIDTAWPIVEPMLAKATARSNGRHTTADIYASIKAGHQQLWVMGTDSVEAACVTSIHRYPNRSFLAVILCGGRNMSSWLSPLIEKLKLFARYNDCDAVEMAGRKGWLRTLATHGFEDEGVLMSLGVSHRQ